MYEELKKAVCGANKQLQQEKLIIKSWGNVSGIDRSSGVVVIKPSGVAYEELTAEKMVVVDLEGKVVEGELNPSSDTPTHVALYKNFADIGGICHTHSSNATAWAQACREIPCFGTTHADYFYGAIPVTREMTEAEIEGDYEYNTGKVIVEKFEGMDALSMPAVLVANHGPFTWGTDAFKAVESAVVLEVVAAMALDTMRINPQEREISRTLLDKHYLRKHGKDAYYGQK
jgi:L-ribulose-5-phosphate 4-epimerase